MRSVKNTGGMMRSESETSQWMSHKLCTEVHGWKLGQGALNNFSSLSTNSCDHNIVSFMRERLRLYNCSILSSNTKRSSQQRATFIIIGRP
jgi:hypothetical protein